jgi:hypothetical protein
VECLNQGRWRGLVELVGDNENWYSGNLNGFRMDSGRAYVFGNSGTVSTRLVKMTVATWVTLWPHLACRSARGRLSSTKQAVLSPPHEPRAGLKSKQIPGSLGDHYRYA